MTKEPTNGETTSFIPCKRWAERDDWHVLVEIAPEPFYPSEDPRKQLEGGRPRIVVKQHRGTKELRVEIFDCSGPLDTTFTNAGVDKDARERAKWFRDVRTARDTLQPLTVRFMCRGDSGNLRLQT